MRPTARAAAALIAAVTMLTLGVPAQAAGPDEWPQIGHDGASTNHNPGEQTLVPSRVLAGLAPAWNHLLPAEHNFSNDTVMADGRIYASFMDLGSTTKIRALDAENGAEIWTRTYENRQAAVVAAADGVVVVKVRKSPTEPSRLEGLEPATGAVLWSTAFTSPDIDTVDGAVYVDGGRILATTWYLEDPPPYAKTPFPVSRPGITALDAATGAVQWTVVGPSLRAAAGGAVYAACQPTRNHGYVELCVLDAASGTERWSTTAPASPGQPTFFAYVTVADGVVVTTVEASAREFLSVYDAADGSHLWTHYPVPLGGLLSPQLTAVAVADGVIYVGSYSGLGSPGESRLWALDARTGQLRWAWSVELPGSEVVGRINVAAGVVYVNYGRYVATFAAADGQPLAIAGLDTTVWSLLGVTGGRIYTVRSTGSSTLTAYQLAPLAPVPGRIEAESTISPVLTAPAEDDDGGQLVGYLSPDGQAIDYPIDVDQAGAYTVSLRVASHASTLSPAPTPQLELQLAGVGVLNSVPIPDTGGWQTWTTVTTSVTLPAGPNRLRIFVPAGSHGFNINWMEFAPASAAPAAGDRAAASASAAGSASASASATPSGPPSARGIGPQLRRPAPAVQRLDTPTRQSRCWKGLRARTEAARARIAAVCLSA